MSPGDGLGSGVLYITRDDRDRHRAPARQDYGLCRRRQRLDGPVVIAGTCRPRGLLGVVPRNVSSCEVVLVDWAYARVDGVNSTSVVVVLVVQLKRCSDCYTMHNSPEQQRSASTTTVSSRQSVATQQADASMLLPHSMAVRHSTSHTQQSQRGLTQLTTIVGYAPWSWHVTTQVQGVL